jgi:hypothetical protein
MRGAWLVAIALVAGCGATPGSFWRLMVKETCRWHRDCGRLYPFTKLSKCESAIYFASVYQSEFEEFCVAYDEERGRACLEYLRASRESCGELSAEPEECREVCGDRKHVGFVFEWVGDQVQALPVVIDDASE